MAADAAWPNGASGPIVIGHDGKLVFDTSRPDGPPRKLLDVSKVSALGWKAHTSLRVGIERSYADFLDGADERARTKG